MAHIFLIDVGPYYPEDNFILVTPKGITTKTIRNVIAERVACSEKVLSFYYNGELYSEIYDKEYWENWKNEQLYMIKPFDYNIYEKSGITGTIYLTKVKTD